MRRREFLAVPAVAGGLLALSGAEPAASAQTAAPANSLGVKAMVFDTFGTVVDWRGSIIREGAQWGKEKNLQIDWGAFADKWRAGYGPSMNKVRTGALPWTKLDVLHRMILDQLLVEYNITNLSEAEKEHWNLVWHRLTAWPDAVEGLTLLKKSYTIATLSNGNVSLLVDMAKFGGLPWDAVLSAELFHHYKPDPEVYLGAVELMSCKPGEVMMVAAHPDDLKAAQALGLKTGYVPRPLERGPAKAAAPPGPMAPGGSAPAAAGAEPSTPPKFDVTAADFIEFSQNMS